MTDYNFLGDPDPGSLKPPVSLPSEMDRRSEPEVFLTGDDELLIETIRQRGALSLRTGTLNKTLQLAAQDHARFQAAHDRMGHQDWGQRSAQLMTSLPDCIGFREVAAMSGFPDPDQGVKGILDAWRNSHDHWVWVNGHCDFWGYAVSFNARSRIWYACGIFADRRHS